MVYSDIIENIRNFAVGHYFWFIADDCTTMHTKRGKQQYRASYAISK